jgi:DNA invertase Pin-like site-specific DNA recombinase
MKRVAIYLRVSTTDQDVDNQRRELIEATQRHGWNVVAEYGDEGVSGAKGRDKRPGFDRLCKAITRREVDLVAACSVDRFGPKPTALGNLPRRATCLRRRSLPTPTRP